MPPTLDEASPRLGDTIIFKGKQSWQPRKSGRSTRLSRRKRSNNSMNEVNIDVEKLLAHFDQQPTSGAARLESPMDEEEEDGCAAIGTDLQSARRTAKPRQRLNAATMEERLVQMQEVRPLPWRDGVEAGAEVETGGDSRRKQIRFGCLLATRGDIQEVPCNSCANGRGKFKHCIALDGFFKGACASCQLSGRPNRCSIKKADEVDSPAASTPAAPTSKNPSQYQPTPTQTPASEPPPAKKRRKASATVPDWESARPQWEQELGESHARSQKMVEMRQKSWATVNSPASVAPPVQNGMSESRSHPGAASQKPVEHRNSMGWATVNQPPSGPVPLQAQASPSAGPVECNGSSERGTAEPVRQEDNGMATGVDVALIDTLPRAKQRMVYGLLSGLQAGINHLQMELEGLKKALGIDED